MSSALEVIEATLASQRFDGVRAVIAAHAEAPKTPEQWFAFCETYQGQTDTILHRLKAAAPDAPLEQFVALTALTISVGLADSAGFPVSVRRQFDAMCREWVALEPHWADHFDLSNPRFVDVMQLATLHRVVAGEVAFALAPRLPHDFLFRCHPLHLPRLIGQIFWSMRGARPILPLHFNYARRNRLVVSQAEFERAVWRVAKMLEQNPRYTGISTNSWFHSAAVRETFPRLAWMRDLFIDGGAFAIDLEAGHADDIGYNSAKRKELYEQGKFLPRHTLILWPRDSVLAWAASRPDLKDEDEALIAPPGEGARYSLPSPPPRPSTRWNSPLHLWDGVKWRRRFGIKYWAALLLIPSAVAAGLVGMAFGLSWDLPTFAIAALVVLTAQYYVSQ
ncbi:MAG: hypothetical protein NW206_15520 [Hyphomonadaceae bacterium]|nr:hypothetical protein [Hyphomonadaceae bacterium]